MKTYQELTADVERLTGALRNAVERLQRISNAYDFDADHIRRFARREAVEIAADISLAPPAVPAPTDTVAFFDPERAKNCAHAWEQHLWEHNREYCPRCGSFRDKAAAPSPVAPTCAICNDTHLMLVGGSDVMCTHCPRPCRSCASAGGAGPYCATTPCTCQCHAAPSDAAPAGPVTAFEVMQEGGPWLGATRSWMQSHLRNGDRVTWGSEQEAGTFTARMCEEIAAAAVAADRGALGRKDETIKMLRDKVLRLELGLDATGGKGGGR